MKATLHFNLDDQHDRLAHTRAVNSTNAYLALHSIFEDVFRQRIKYGELDLDSENLLIDVRSKCLEILQEYNVNLSDLE
jgi:hypothetical protein